MVLLCPFGSVCFGVVLLYPFDSVCVGMVLLCPFVSFSLGSFTTKTGRHDIAEILLKVALSTIHQIK